MTDEGSLAGSTAAGVVLAIGGERIVIRTPAPRPVVYEELRRWFGWFVAAGRPDVTLFLELDADRVMARGAEAGASMLPPAVEYARGCYAWQWPGGISAGYDMARGEGRFSAPVFPPHAFRFFLLLVCVLRLLERDGLIVHAGALTSHGAALLLLGTSGAGKTTLIRDAAPCDPLADDLAILRRADGLWWVYRSPWMSGGTGNRWSMDGAVRRPLEAGFVLDRRVEEFCDSFPPLPAAQALMRCLAWMPAGGSSAGGLAALTAMVSRLSVDAPWYRLSYVRSQGSPWRLLRRTDERVEHASNEEAVETHAQC